MSGKLRGMPLVKEMLSTRETCCSEWPSVIIEEHIMEERKIIEVTCTLFYCRGLDQFRIQTRAQGVSIPPPLVHSAEACWHGFEFRSMFRYLLNRGYEIMARGIEQLQKDKWQTVDGE